MNFNKTEKIVLRVTPETKALFKAQAQSREMHLSDWMLQAARKYAANGKRFNKANDVQVVELWPSGWPKTSKCFHCGLSDHDPREAHAPMYDDKKEFARWIVQARDYEK